MKPTSVSIPLLEFEGLNGMGGHFAAAAPIGGFQNGPAGRRPQSHAKKDRQDRWMDGRTDAADGREGSSVQCRFGSGGLNLGA